MFIKWDFKAVKFVATTLRWNDRESPGDAGKYERFAPDYMMSESWKRLINGTPEQHDLTLIKHEVLESELIKEGYTQEEAHIITSKQYNYAKEAAEFYDKIKKYKD